MIGSRHWKRLFDAVFSMNEARDSVSFMNAVGRGLSALVPADHYAIHALDPDSGRLAVENFPEDPFRPEEVAYYTEYSDALPLVRYYRATGEKRARRMSDVIPSEEWWETEFYAHTLARTGFRYTLGLPVEVTDKVVAGMTMNRRDHDFTPFDCELLDAFGDHFRQAWKRDVDPWSPKPHPKPNGNPGFHRFGLTARQTEVLFWMAEGKQNREIATILGISLATVQEHVANVVDRLGQENRHAATVHALREMRVEIE